MGLLDDLKKEADSLKNQEVARTQTIHANAASVDRALRKAFYYLNELFKQLNVVRPPCPRDYDLHTVGKIDGLSQSDYRVEFRTSQRNGSEHFESLQIAFRRGKPEKITVKREAEFIERFRDLLWQNNLRFTSEALRNDRRVIISETFTINCDVVCGVDVEGDYEAGAIRFKMKNVEDFGPTLYTLEPDSVTDPALEELAKLLIGKDSKFGGYNRRPKMDVSSAAQNISSGQVKVPTYAVDPKFLEPAHEEKKSGLLGSLKSVFKRD
jgi:hypothetical protein